MTPPAPLQSFRARLTLRWTLAVGVLLGLANVAVYAGASAYLHRWLDGHVRTIAATEAASSTDGATDVHLHESFFAQLEAGAYTEKIVQIFDERGTLVLQSSGLGDGPPLITPDVIRQGLAGAVPLADAEVHGRQARLAVLTAAREGRRYAVAVGLFADDVARGLTFLTWLLGGVWLVSVAGTAALGYLLASRALSPVARITERAAWIAQGHFDGRLDEPQVHDEVGRMTVLLNSMLDRLQRALDANRRFAADASHELRSPITAMAGELDVALRHPRTAESYRETLVVVRRRLAALTELAGNLMLLSRVQEGADDIALREVPLAPVVEEAFARWQPAAAARGITLVPRGLGAIRVYGDPGLVARVLDNVIANAVHYNREGGSVTVSASLTEPAADQWAPTLVTIDVRDEGPGIPPGDEERVFERFFRVDESRHRHTGGSGLGLAICREVVRALGGTIRVGASSSAGTTIEITLPGRDGDRPHEPIAMHAAPAALSVQQRPTS